MSIQTVKLLEILRSLMQEATSVYDANYNVARARHSQSAFSVDRVLQMSGIELIKEYEINQVAEDAFVEYVASLPAGVADRVEIDRGGWTEEFTFLQWREFCYGCKQDLFAIIQVGA